jgi:pimeloyl-ACP methyl ester carboxylesterase
VVYLLHGGGGGYRDWSNYSDVARFAERGLILVIVILHNGTGGN